MNATILKCSLVAVLVSFGALPYADIQNASAQIQGCNTTMTTRIDQHYQGPVFVDAYWTESSRSIATGAESTNNMLQREVGPGEGKATLAVVLLNRNTVDISAATGYLQLPEGYEPIGTSIYPEARAVMSASGNRLGFNQPAVASFNSIIPAKSSFTLYFDLNVLDTAKVGTKPTQLVVQYYRVNDLGLCTSALITFPLVLSGKTILDVKAIDSHLVPKTPNSVRVSIMNKGTSDVTGVVASIINLGESRSTGSRTDDSAVVLQSSSTKLINLGANTFDIGRIPANTTVVIDTIVFPSREAAGTVQNMDIQLSYGNAYGDRQNSIFRTGLVVLPNPIDASLNIVYQNSANSHILPAEKLGDLNFVVINNSKSDLSDVIISILSQSPSVTVVGDSKWSFPMLESGESKQISTKVIAARNMIGSPTSFTVNGSYVLDGEEKTDSLNLGAFVTGDVKIHVYDLTINYVGNTPNIVGNLLNQGNTAALYTNVEMLSVDGSGAVESDSVVNPAEAKTLSSQYVGDVSADSSIPFSIPVQTDLLRPGLNTVTLKIVYADNLKNFHEMITENAVNFAPRPSTSSDRSSQQSSLDVIQNPVLIIGIIGGIVATAVIIKKKKSSSRGIAKTQFESDLESLLDEHVQDKKDQSGTK